ncbi:PQQ-dependent dehydrogenase, methanol/ethanol family [Novosphingobium aquimarinum]|uniref:PQQ-dependent dehydrogenase, methanol/ethanol family n=1 Tax=Novosphingobium aquimarinum TaxID=2682494 RepID=UPI001E50E2C0|nr:PQQ-dependent dehydrogenase, methanol/ethanol family [Novosphingobium aquimarinum]
MAVLHAAAIAGPAAVDNDRLTAADREPGEWMAPGRTYGEQRYSPLAQITADNVSNLGLAWYADLPVDRGVEASPIVVDGVLYNIEPWNVTVAYDAKTGKELWRFDPKVDREKGRHACCDIVTRGLAAWNGKIIIATLDGRLIAIDAATGKQVWSTATFDPVWPYTITGAPRVYNGKVLIGNAGAEGAARGYVTAYDVETGKQIWRFYTVPGNPADGFTSDAMAMAAKTWTGDWWKRGGGGTVWDSIVYDPDLDLVYIGVGNGGPWPLRYRSPQGGDNLFLSSIVALKGDTGEYVWHYQTTPGDEWDFTATQSLILADLVIKGKTRKVLMQAPKNGYYYVIDRATGELISAEPYVAMNWSTGIDANGKPIVNPEARYGEVPVIVTPGPGGGHNWNPMAFSPQTGLAYFPVTEMYMAFSVNPDFEQTPGQMSQLGISTTGYDITRKAAQEYAAKHNKAWLTAWDPVAQKERWRVPYPVRGSGGLLATAGNLVFQGTVRGTFAAYSADAGKLVWEMPVQQVPIAAAISYSVDGEQYIAVNAGWGGGLAHSTTAESLGFPFSKSPRLLVFRLGATEKLPPVETKDEGPYRPEPTKVDDATIARGETLFADHCAACHGARARGGVKDLRMMSRETHAEFQDIVIGGSRREKGMASFADIISVPDAKAIHAYLIRRTNEDWDEMYGDK